MRQHHADDGEEKAKMSLGLSSLSPPRSHLHLILMKVKVYHNRVAT